MINEAMLPLTDIFKLQSMQEIEPIKPSHVVCTLCDVIRRPQVLLNLFRTLCCFQHMFHLLQTLYPYEQ